MFKRKAAGMGLKKADFKESIKDCNNPGRGWYQIYTFVIGDKNKEHAEIFTGSKEERIALVLMDIGKFKSTTLTSEALNRFTQILEAFRLNEKEMILRIVYDREGKGMEKEPSLFSFVLTHMRQIGPLLIPFANQIVLLQGLFIGSWGEMHGSKFLDSEKLREMLSVLDEASGRRLRFALRRPVQVRMIGARNLNRPDNLPVHLVSEENRIGFFDDAMFASANDMGTFGTESSKAAGWEVAWAREEELVFAEGLSLSVPCGGEAIAGAAALTPEVTLKILKDMHVSYLNCIHDEKLLTQWKQKKYQNWNSLYDYIGAHMGYRFVVRDAVIRHEKELQFLVVLENTGFANLCEEAELYLIVEAVSGEEQLFLTPYDIRTLRGGKQTEISFPFGGAGRGDCCYLELVRKKDESSLRFANRAAEERILLGKIV